MTSDELREFIQMKACDLSVHEFDEAEAVRQKMKQVCCAHYKATAKEAQLPSELVDE